MALQPRTTRSASSRSAVLRTGQATTTTTTTAGMSARACKSEGRGICRPVGPSPTCPVILSDIALPRMD